MDESVLYLGESVGLDEPNTSKTVQCPMLLNGYPFPFLFHTRYISYWMGSCPISLDIAWMSLCCIWASL